jgi:hypothetical protein
MKEGRLHLLYLSVPPEDTEKVAICKLGRRLSPEPYCASALIDL